MSITDRITDLMKQHGVVRVTFANNQQGQPLVAAEQVVPTTQGQSQMQHQCLGSSMGEALENVTRAVTHCSEMQSKILRVHENSN